MVVAMDGSHFSDVLLNGAMDGSHFSDVLLNGAMDGSRNGW